MPKPSQLPIWATDLSNNTEPSSGQKATGWTVNQTAVSSYFNWLFYTLYLWIAYIDAGIWDDNLTISGNLSVQGNTALGNGAGDTTTIAGPATFTTGIANNVTLTLGATAAVDQHITVSGTGKFKHGSRAIHFGFDDRDVISLSGGTVGGTLGVGGVQQSASITAYYKLPALQTEHQVLNVAVFAQSGTGAKFTLMEYDFTTPSYSPITGTVDTLASAGSPGIALLTPSSPTTVGTSRYVLKVETVGATVDIYAGAMTYDLP